MMKPGILVAAAVLVLFPDFAEAKPAHSTKYTYYTVGGNSAESIYKAMLNKGPRVNGAKAYAATTATTRQDGKLMQSKSCRIEDYQLRLDFVIKLPKIKNEKALASCRPRTLEAILQLPQDARGNSSFDLARMRCRTGAQGAGDQGEILRRSRAKAEQALGADPRSLLEET